MEKELEKECITMIDAIGGTSDSSNATVLRLMQSMYVENDICLGELLSQIKPAEIDVDLTMEEVFQIVLEAKLRIDGNIYREYDGKLYILQEEEEI
ncbi:MAG: hypothetical protein ACRC0G_07185 [Fusobacteriaceae bacterium]